MTAIPKLLIAGGRDFDDYAALRVAALKAATGILSEENGFELVVVSGTCDGADKLGERWAAECNYTVTRMPADWTKHGKAAGPIRNREMAKVATHALVFWDGKSRGTKNMIDELHKVGTEPCVVTYSKEGK